jgi:hypothetical protein
MSRSQRRCSHRPGFPKRLVVPSRWDDIARVNESIRRFDRLIAEANHSGHSLAAQIFKRARQLQIERKHFLQTRPR